MKKDVIHTYAAYNKNEKIRINSSSGGVFTLLAEFVLNDGGVVYGVAMSNDCYSNHFERVFLTHIFKSTEKSHNFSLPKLLILKLCRIPTQRLLYKRQIFL